MAQAKGTNFDFVAYNALMNTAGVGLRIFLVERLLLDLSTLMMRFENPLAPDMVLTHQKMKGIREENTRLSEEYRAKQLQNEGSAAIDNATVKELNGALTKASNSADAGAVA